MAVRRTSLILTVIFAVLLTAHAQFSSDKPQNEIELRAQVAGPREPLLLKLEIVQ